MSELTRLRTERDGAVLSVVLSRPEVHDAFDDVMVSELTRAFRDAAADDAVRVVLLRSTGRHFCAGADLEWMRRMADATPEDARRDAEALDDMLLSIADCPKPVVARVQGAALGGGAGLVTAADVAIASERARFGFTEVRLGILPAVISPYVLRKLSPGAAQALFLTGERFDARRALELGLVHRVVPEVDLHGVVDDVVASLLEGSPAAQAGVKRLVADVASRDHEAARAATTRAIAEARASRDGREGMQAFLDKRPAPWAPPRPDGEP